MVALQAAPTWCRASTRRPHWPLAAMEQIRVTSIETHFIEDLGFTEFMDFPLRHMYGSDGMTQRTVYIAHTNTGLEGYGEYSGPPAAQAILDHYIGSSPFEHLNDEVHLGLGTAMYDLMGKATGLPCHRLFGAQCRTYVPVSSWFNATSPARMAEAVKYYAKMGHTWMKFHLSPFENVIEQTKAMQAVAPAGFQIHYDFTMYGDQGGQGGLTHVAQLLEALSEFPIAGCYEDVLWQHDMVGYEELRRRANRPIGLHHFPLGVTTEMMQHRMGDFYMLGHGLIGTNAKKAGVFEAAKAPFMMQNTGGAITRAMNAHMSSVFTGAHATEALMSLVNSCQSISPAARL